MKPFPVKVTIARGDVYVQTFTLVRSGFTWTGSTVTVHVRETADGELLHDCDTTLTESETGTAVCTFTIPATVTATLPTACVAEIQVEKAAADFGPYTPARIYLTVDPDFTHD